MRTTEGEAAKAGGCCSLGGRFRVGLRFGPDPPSALALSLSSSSSKMIIGDFTCGLEVDGRFARADGPCVGVGWLTSAFGWGGAGKRSCPGGSEVWVLPGLLSSTFCILHRRREQTPLEKIRRGVRKGGIVRT